MLDIKKYKIIDHKNAVKITKPPETAAPSTSSSNSLATTLNTQSSNDANLQNSMDDAFNFD